MLLNRNTGKQQLIATFFLGNEKYFMILSLIE